MKIHLASNRPAAGRGAARQGRCTAPIVSGYTRASSPHRQPNTYEQATTTTPDLSRRHTNPSLATEVSRAPSAGHLAAPPRRARPQAPPRARDQGAAARPAGRQGAARPRAAPTLASPLGRCRAAVEAKLRPLCGPSSAKGGLQLRRNCAPPLWPCSLRLRRWPRARWLKPARHEGTRSINEHSQLSPGRPPS